MRARLFFVALLCVGCNRTSTDTLLSGGFLTAGQSAIELIQPLSSAASPPNPVLVWTSRSGTNRYRVQVSATNDFSTLVLDKLVAGTNYAVLNSDLIGISSLDARTYYWRVRVPVTTNDLLSATGQLNIVTFSGKVGGENIVYVDGAFDPSFALTSFGNKTHPFRSIQRAIDAAVTLRNDNNTVAAEVRVAAGSYTDEINMRANVSLRGGYSRTDWSRDTSTNSTFIAAKFDRVLIFSADITAVYRDTTSVDGFILNSQGLTPARDNYAALMSGAGSITNCVINVTTNAGIVKSTGISDSGLGSFINRNTFNIVSGVAGTASAITLTGSTSTIISNNTITVSTTGAGNIFGILLNSTTIGYAAQVNNNRLSVTGNTAQVVGVQVQSSGVGNNINVYNNALTLTTAGNIYGLYSAITAGSVILNNNGVYAFSTGATTISVRFASTAIGIATYNTAFGGTNNGGSNCYAYDLPTAGTISNNIAFCGGAVANRTGYREVDSSSNPTNFMNNLTFDTGFALYIDNGTQRGTQSELNMLATTVGTGTATGNLAPWATGYGPNYVSVFRATTSKGVAFSLTDPTTWEIKGFVNATNGPADVDASGSWSTGDMGANAAQLGPQ